MRKIIICLLVMCILLFSGCSCNDKQTLIFDTNSLSSLSTFNRNYTVSLGNYDDETNTFTYKDEDKDKYGDIVLSGTYNISLTSCARPEVPDISEDFKNSLDNLFKLHTKLDLTVIYKAVSDEEHNDTIETTAYFSGKNLHPVYSEVVSSTTYLGYNGEKAVITEIDTTDKIVFDIDTYTVSRKASSKTSEETAETNDTYDYEQGTVIDNAILMFALENFNVENATSKTLSVVTPSYGKEKTLSVSCYALIPEVTNTNYKNVKLESFILKPDKSGCFGGNTGKCQIVYLNETSNGHEIVRYISPLTSYDSNYVCLGALQFDLEND